MPKILRLATRRTFILTFLGLILTSIIIFTLSNYVWHDDSGFWVNVAASFLSLAISIPVIYLIIENTIESVNKSRWTEARNKLLKAVYRKTLSILNIITLEYGSLPILEILNNSEAAIKEARRLSTELSDGIEWAVVRRNRLDILVVSINQMFSLLLDKVRFYPNILSDDPDVFEKIFDVENKIDDLSAIAGFKSFPKGNWETSTEQGQQIVVYTRELIRSLLVLIDLTAQYQ